MKNNLRLMGFSTSAVIVFFLFIAVLADLQAGEVTHIYRFDQPKMERQGDYTTMSFPGTSLFGAPGRPSLPFQPVRLMLPPGETADSLGLEFTDPITLPGSYLLMPGQEYRPLSFTGEPDFLNDAEAYASSENFPAKIKYAVRTGYMHGFGVALSAFTPVVYTASVGRVTYYRTVRLTVYCSAKNQPGDLPLSAASRAGRAKEVCAFTQNPEMASAYAFDFNPPRQDDYSYLIVTTDAYASSFDTLVRFYTERGLPARCYTLSYIDTAATGSDTQAKIRDFIRTEYLNRGIEYVLLGGDVEIIPYRGFYCTVLSGGSYLTDYGIPSDLYYSALDGSWDADLDNIFGEVGEEDALPEVAVGRMTFSSSAELQRMIHKTTTYQQNPVVADLDRPLLAGEYLYGPPKLTYGSDYLNLLIGHQTYNGYVTDGIPETDDLDSLYDEYGTWTKAQLLAEINAGRSYVHHVGHANWSYAMRFSNSDITNANFSQVNGITHGYQIVYTHGCICGGFDYTDCILELMLGIDNFAAGIIGNSRYGWFVEGTQDGPSQHLHREFVDALYSDSLFRIGMAHMVSKAEMAPFLDLPDEYEPGAHRWCFYDCNALGDPAMALWTAPPHSLDISCPPFVAIGAQSLPVSALYNGSPQKSVTIAFFQNDSLLGFGQTGPSGECVLELHGSPVAGEAVLVVSGMNVSRFEIPLSVSDLWLGVSSHWDDPQNWRSGQIPDSSKNVIIPLYPQGGNFPEFFPGQTAHCKAIYLEPGVNLHLGQNDMLILHGN